MKLIHGAIVDGITHCGLCHHDLEPRRLRRILLLVHTSTQMNLGDTWFIDRRRALFWPASIIGCQASVRPVPKGPPLLMLNGGGRPNLPTSIKAS
jgi:hypothetical protein